MWCNSIPQYTPVYPSTPQYMSVHPSTCQYTPVHVSIPQYMSVYPSIPQYMSVHPSMPNIPQYSPVHPSIPQFTLCNSNFQILEQKWYRQLTTPFSRSVNSLCVLSNFVVGIIGPLQPLPFLPIPIILLMQLLLYSGLIYWVRHATKFLW